MAAQFRRLALAIFAFLQFAGTAFAQTWPSRPVTLVVPQAAGSGGDVVARILAPHLSAHLGQQVVVENIGGAGGMTGVSRVASAQPDGYRFVLGHSGTHAINQTLYKKPLYNAATDFSPVALIAEVPFVVVARKDLPAENLQEFMVYAKANHATLRYGSGGVGSGVHLACALLNSAIGIDVTHIPYRGGGPAMQDLIGGRLDYQCTPPGVAGTHIENKSVKTIAILTKNRSPLLPEVASAHEQGLSGFEATGWNAIFLPKETPTPIVQKLHGSIVHALDTLAVQQQLKKVGLDPVGPDRRSPDYLQKFVPSEIEKWATAIKAANIALQ